MKKEILKLIILLIKVCFRINTFETEKKKTLTWKQKVKIMDKWKQNKINK